jgi:hypothetical protein
MDKVERRMIALLVFAVVFVSLGLCVVAGELKEWLGVALSLAGGSCGVAASLFLRRKA